MGSSDLGGIAARVILLLLAACGGVKSFTYAVLVQDRNTRQNIANARVSLVVSLYFFVGYFSPGRAKNNLQTRKAMACVNPMVIEKPPILVTLN
jgi:hypothetical protein